MSNLIITIISIALVAITTLMGVYFLGPISDSYFASARAQTIIGEAKQILAAANLWLVENNQNLVSNLATNIVNDLNYITPTPLVPNYISTYPRLYRNGTLTEYPQYTVGGNGLRNGERLRTGCAQIGSETVNLSDYLCSLNSKNFFMIVMSKPNTCTGVATDTANNDFTADSDAVKMCLKINEQRPQSAFVNPTYTIDSATGLLMKSNQTIFADNRREILDCSTNIAQFNRVPVGGCFITANKKGLMIVVGN